jgi:tetratricopeptide (TPR) repeat protein
MQTKLMRLTLGAAAALAASFTFADIKWMPSYQAAIHEAKSTNKLVMVEFYAPWDLHGISAPNWCGRMEGETFKDPKSQEVAARFVPVRLNVDKDGKELKARFHVTNYPTVLFLDKNESVVGVIDGFEDVAEFTKHGNLFLKDHAEFGPAMAKYKTNPKDLDAVTRLGTIYGDRYQIAEALAKVKEAEAIDSANKTDKVSDLYNSVGDYYQNASKFEPAIKYFQKAADTSKSTDKRAYAYLSIATCLFTMDPSEGPEPTAKQLANAKAAIAPLQACLKLPNLKPDDKDLATRLLEAAKRATSGR